MSGGSMGYLCSRIEEAYFHQNTPERRALKAHLDKLAKALRAVEWNDSGDGADDEAELIREALGDAAILESAVQHAKEAHKELGAELARVEGSWLSKEMRTPAKGFPALRLDPNCTVIVRSRGATNLQKLDGKHGILRYPSSCGRLWVVTMADDGSEITAGPENLERVG